MRGLSGTIIVRNVTGPFYVPRPEVNRVAGEWVARRVVLSF